MFFKLVVYTGINRITNIPLFYHKLKKSVWYLVQNQSEFGIICKMIHFTNTEGDRQREVNHLIVRAWQGIMA